MKNSKLPILFVSTGVVISIVVILLIYPLGKRGPWELTIATGTPGGTYFPLGQQFARILEKLPEIRTATSIPTSASIENIHLLSTGQADLAFVFRPAIASVTQEERENIRVLSRLYADVVQVVVRKDALIRNLSDLEGKRVYVGKVGSGTKVVVESILETVKVSPSSKVTDGSFTQASQMLINGDIDAAFFAAGKLSVAPKRALESGYCNLLDLRDSIDQIRANIPDLTEVDIPANLYVNQTNAVRTLGAEALLMCRSDLNQHLARMIVETLFDNIGNLLLAHARAQDIRLENAFEDLPESVELHPGAEKFRDQGWDELLIATGSLTGKYYELGKRIQTSLKERGIPARVIHTEGSVENARLLLHRPTIAIMQYDVALASTWGAPEHIYKNEAKSVIEKIRIPEIKDMRRIATLHTEKVHIFIRRHKLSDIQHQGSSILALENARVCLGPENSGTRVLAETILAHHGIQLESPTYLSVSAMIDRIHSGEVDGGFFMSHVPANAIISLLDNEGIRLLPIVPKHTTKLVGGSAFSSTTIEAGSYGCQLDDEPAIETIQTKAVLVTRENLPFDVQKITEAIFEGAAYLALDPMVMAEELTSLPLHPDAENFYRKAGYLPSDPAVNWLRQSWYILTILVILTTAVRGYREVRQRQEADRIREKIYAVSLEADDSQTVFKLLQVKSSIRRTMEKEWRRRGRLDQARQQSLRNLVDERIEITQKICARSFIAEINAISREKDKDNEWKNAQYTILQERIWQELENYELTTDQHSFLMGVIRHRQEGNSDC